MGLRVNAGPAVRLAAGGLLAAGAAAAGALAGSALERLLMARTAQPNGELPPPMPNAVVREVVASDGSTLHVEIDELPDYGAYAMDADGAEAPMLTVILVHGYALSLDSWRYQRADLAGVVRVVSYDQRSHGRSQRAEFDTHHVDQLGQDLAAVIDAVAPDGPLVLIGHSMGGMTIMALAERHPQLIAERVAGVAFIATSAGGLDHASLGLPSFLGPILQRVASPAASVLARSKELVEFGRRSTTDLSLLITRLYSFGSLASDEAGRFVEAMIAATPIDVLAEFLPALQDHDKRAALEVFQGCEVIVIVGDTDRLTPLEHSEQIIEYLPGADLFVIPHAGHMVFVEHHEDVDALLLEFIDRVQRNVRSPRSRRNDSGPGHGTARAAV